MLKYFFKKSVALVCLASMMLNYGNIPVSADSMITEEDAVGTKKEYEPFTDTSPMSDEDFFGVWDEEKELWSTVPKINYDYSEALKATENYVKLGGYGLAKEALLEYYKNRNSIVKPPLYSGENESYRALTMLDMYNISEDYITTFTVDSVEDYEKYEINLGTFTANGAFMLAAKEKDGDVLSIISKECDPERAPVLELYYSTGEVRTLQVTMDSYTRAYDDKLDYSEDAHGDETELCVKDSWYQDETGRYLPYSSDTREAYISFDNALIDKTDHIATKLIIYAKLRPEDGSEELSQNEKEIMVFNSYNKSWRENETQPGSYPVLSWSSISHGHYSWNGLPGGFDWKAPVGCLSEYINANSRFQQLPALLIPYMESGNEDYLYKSIDMVLDFIQDAGAGTPPKRDIEAAQRMIELIPAFFYFAETDMFNADAATAILKYMWEEGQFLYEAPLYYDYNNRGAWHTTGFFCLATYFPEFNDCEEWNKIIDERLSKVIYAIVADDGCYGEATFGYPIVVLGYFKRILEACDDAGIEPPAYLKERAGKLAHYLMNMTNPNGSTPNWGEGGRASTKASLIYDIGKLLDDDELMFWGSNGTEGVEPEETTFRYDKFKIVTSRTDWGNSAYMLFMNAKNGGYHNHKDSLSINFFAKDREVLSDTGMTSYDSKHPHFDWQRHQTKSHNTIEIDNTAQRGDTSTLDPEINGDSAIEVYSSGEADRINAWTDATAGFRHYRNVTFMKKLKFLIVSDMVHPFFQNDKKHTYTQNWHSRIKSDVRLDNESLIGTTNFNGGSNIKIFQVNKDNMTASLENGYDNEGQTTTKYFSYKKNQSGDVAFDTVLFPVEEGSEAELALKKIETGVDGTVASAIDIEIFRNEDEKQTVTYYNSHEYDENGAPAPNERAFGDYTTDAASVIVTRNVNNDVESLQMNYGSKLSFDGKKLLEISNKVSGLTVSFEGKNANIEIDESELELITALSFYAPVSVNKVVLNGSDVKFTQNDSSVVVSDITSDTTTDTDADGDTDTDSDAGNNSGGGGGTVSSGGNAGASVKPFPPGGIKVNIEADENADDALAKTESELEMEFTDVLEHWAANEIADMFEKGIVKGVSDTLFMPDREITRAEFAVLAVRSLGLPEVDYRQEFTDVSADDWYAAYIQTAYDAGLINGDEGAFRPNDNITRAELAVITSRMCKEVEQSRSVVFTDEDDFADWAKPYIVRAAELGIVKGMEDGAFKAEKYSTRAEAVVMLSRVLNLLEMGG